GAGPRPRGRGSRDLRGRAGSAAAPVPRRAQEAGGGRLPAPGGGALSHHDRREAARRPAGERPHGPGTHGGPGLIRPLVVLIAVLAGASVASAHGMRTAYLELTESADGIVLVTWKTTLSDATVQPRLPGRCTPIGDTTTAATNARTFSVRCDDGLAG